MSWKYLNNLLMLSASCSAGLQVAGRLPWRSLQGPGTDQSRFLSWPPINQPPWIQALVCAPSQRPPAQWQTPPAADPQQFAQGVAMCFDDVGFWWPVNLPVFVLWSWQNVPLQDTNRSMGYLGWRWANGLKIFPLPVPHTANIFLLKINGT